MLIVPLALASSAVAESTWLTVTPEGAVMTQQAVPFRAPHLTVNESGDAGLQATLSCPGLALTPRKTKGGEFVAVNWPDAPMRGEIGAPAQIQVLEVPSELGLYPVNRSHWSLGPLGIIGRKGESS